MLLLRTFIRRSLAAYFQRPANPVGALPNPLPLDALPGEAAYRHVVRAAYDALGTAWLTPSELLRPHYGRAVAQWILRDWHAHGNGAPLHIVEVGGGTGRLARDILDTLQNEQQTPTTNYTLIEPSPILADLQRRTTAPHQSRVVLQRDALDADAFENIPNNQPNQYKILLMAEVLDNLPHDRIVMLQSNDVAATFVEPTALQETLVSLDALNDPLIDRCLHTALHLNSSSWKDRVRSWLDPIFTGRPPMNYRNARVMWLPTGALQLFDNARRGLGGHTVLALDFDHLPDVCIEGVNAPIVSDVRRGRAVDSSTYLLQPGSADILFPTDFALLDALLHGDCTVTKVGDLMRSLPAVHHAATASGFNPLVHDFSNTTSFIARVK